MTTIHKRQIAKKNKPTSVLLKIEENLPFLAQWKLIIFQCPHSSQHPPPPSFLAPWRSHSLFSFVFSIAYSFNLGASPQSRHLSITGGSQGGFRVLTVTGDGWGIHGPVNLVGHPSANSSQQIERCHWRGDLYRPLRSLSRLFQRRRRVQNLTLNGYTIFCSPERAMSQNVKITQV